MMLDTLIAPLRRLDPNLQIRLWGAALTLALTLTDTLGALSGAQAGTAPNPMYLVNVAVYSLSSAAVCQLMLTPFLHKRTRLLWRWLAVIAGVLANPLVEVLSWGLFLHPEVMASPSRFWSIFLFSLFATGGPRVLLWISLMLVLIHQMRRREEEVRLRDMETAFTLARLARLETQINPHFLFNALNTISALVSLERKSDAVGAVASLGELLRRSLKQGASPLSSVEDEIESASLYLQIEALRFPERLTVVWKIDDRFRSLPIPRFTLQPLLENVVKHSVAKSVGMVTATVEVAETAGSRCSISVRNDGFVPAVSADCSEQAGGGIGLTNLKQRTEILFPDVGELICGPVDDNHFECKLTIPMTPAEASMNPKDEEQ